MSPLLQWPQPSNFRTAELIEGTVHFQNHGLLEILHEIYSPDHHWIPGKLTFSIFMKNPSAHSCHPVSLTIVLFNISANPPALNTLEVVYSLYICVQLQRQRHALVFPHFLQFLTPESYSETEKMDELSQGDLLHPLFELAISLLLGSAGGQGGLHLWEEPLAEILVTNLQCNQLPSTMMCSLNWQYQFLINYIQLIYSFMMSPRCNIVNIKYILLFVSIRGQMSRVYNDILVRKQSYALVYTVRDCIYIYMYIFIHNVNIFPYIIHSQHCSYDHEPWSPCPEKNMEKSGEKSGPKRSHKLILIFSISFFG